MVLLEEAHLKAHKKRIPLTFQFDLTYRCHHHCRHCYLPESWRQGREAPPEVNTILVQEILAQLARAGAFLLTFSGGEIFLRPDLLDIVAQARRLDFSISLMTTGTLGLEDEEIGFLADLGINGILFSFYSLNPQVHDSITQVPGSWDRV